MGDVVRANKGGMLDAVDGVARVVNEYVFDDIPDSMQYQIQCRQL